MLAKFRGHLRSHVIAYLALFFAFSGTAIAAKPLVTGADIQDDSVTGADVVESSLVGVDADKLDGKNSTDFVGRSWAVVRADGSLARQAGALNAARVNTGTYVVDFVELAGNCAIVATLGKADATVTPQGQITASPNLPGNVVVETADSAGTLTDRDFSVALVC